MSLLMLSFSSFLGLLFLFMEAPLTLGLLLILQTIALSLMTGSMIKTFWFLYLLILIFIGGMLVLFIYVSSIFPNEKFPTSQKTLTTILALCTTMSLLTSAYQSFYFSHSPHLDFKALFLMSESSSMCPTNKIFSSQTSILLIFLVNYLFYCMIVVIKITNFFSGPLRKMSYV